jgi:Fe-Mn family superoxide dismutase
MGFRLPELNFPYDALEPSIDAKTMEIHHSKHHNGYTNNLNNAIKDTDLDSVSIEDILTNLDMSNKALRNNAGGYYNHKLFWEVISPNKNNGISPEFLELINNSFGSMEEFSSQFSKAAATQFGSGWAWLCAFPDGSLKVCATANQDNPLMPGIGCGGTPILGVDVWEHAYYLNYQNRRVDYISAFIDLINWEVVHSNYTNR